ncbi:MAG: TIGR03620 family F420-dependent LLM class oxidoreductase [Candidatus Limnocylindrales bacterium]|jgi:probable F420-dependent oxidoreductase
MSLARLHGIDPGRIGLFAGPLNGQSANVQRDFVREMEQLGYGTLWYGESLAREAFAQGAIYLAASERLVIASGIANIWARDAAAMANGGRTLAEAWPGRFILGIGVGHATNVRVRGHDYARPYSAMSEYLDAMRTAPWRGPDVEVPPIVLAALGPRMVGLAGDRTAGAYPYFTTTAHVREVRSILGPEPFLAADLPVVLAADLAAARAVGDRHLSYYLGSVNYRNNLLRLGWSEADLEPPGSGALFEAIVAWGGLDGIAQAVRERFEAGADQVVLNLVAADASTPPLAEMRQLAALNSRG